MRKLSKPTIIILVAAMTLVACTKETENIAPPKQGGVETTITAIAPGVDTRMSYIDQLDYGSGSGTIQTNWSNGDKITIVNTLTDEEKTFTLTAGSGTQTGTFSGVMPEYSDESSLAAYHPTRTIDFTQQEQNGNANTAHLTAYHSMEGTISWGNITFLPKFVLMAFELEVPSLFIENSEILKSVNLSTNSGDAFYTVYSDTQQTTGSSITMKLTDVTPVDNKVKLYMMIAPNQPISTGSVIDIILETNGNSYQYTSGVLTSPKTYEPGKAYTAVVEASEWTTTSIFNNAVGGLTVNQISETYEGSGTTEDPYLISSARLLRKLIVEVINRNSYNGTYFKLSTNIHVTSDNWVAVGYSSDRPFNGSFDGDGYKITGTLKSNNSIGFIGFITNPTSAVTIENLTVSANVIANTYNIGGIVGNISSGEMSPVTIDNCHFAGAMSGRYSIGGIVGIANNAAATISNCTTRGTILATATSGNSEAGGIIGTLGLGPVTVTDCTNYANVTGESTAGGNVGGIVGSLNTNITGIQVVTNCVNNGTIDASASSVGGIVGSMEYNATGLILSGNTNNGAVGNPNILYVGGIVGYVSKSNTFNNNTSNSTQLQGSGYVGGILGYVSTITGAVATENGSVNNSGFPNQGVK